MTSEFQSVTLLLDTKQAEVETLTSELQMKNTELQSMKSCLQTKEEELQALSDDLNSLHTRSNERSSQREAALERDLALHCQQLDAARQEHAEVTRRAEELEAAVEAERGRSKREKEDLLTRVKAKLTEKHRAMEEEWKKRESAWQERLSELQGKVEVSTSNCCDMFSAILFILKLILSLRRPLRSLLELQQRRRSSLDSSASSLPCRTIPTPWRLRSFRFCPPTPRPSFPISPNACMTDRWRCNAFLSSKLVTTSFKIASGSCRCS